MEVLIYIKSTFTKWRLDGRVQGPSGETRARPATGMGDGCLTGSGGNKGREVGESEKHFKTRLIDLLINYMRKEDPESLVGLNLCSSYLDGGEMGKDEALCTFGL